MVTVDPDSPAELAKIEEGDVVLKIGDREITTSDVLAAEIRKRKPGQDVTLKIERDGKPMDIKVKLGEYPENEAFREMELRFPGIFGPDMPPPAAQAPKSALPGRPRDRMRPGRSLQRPENGPSRRGSPSASTGASSTRNWPRTSASRRGWACSFPS